MVTERASAGVIALRELVHAAGVAVCFTTAVGKAVLPARPGGIAVTLLASLKNFAGRSCVDNISKSFFSELE